MGAVTTTYSRSVAAPSGSRNTWRGEGMGSAWRAAGAYSMGFPGRPFGCRVPPRRGGRESWPRGRLVGMEAERNQHRSPDADGDPAVPATVRARAAGQVDVQVVDGERHPVDAPVPQSSADGSRGMRSALQILVRGDGHPVARPGSRSVHADIMPEASAARSETVTKSMKSGDGEPFPPIARPIMWDSTAQHRARTGGHPCGRSSRDGWGGSGGCGRDGRGRGAGSGGSCRG